MKILDNILKKATISSAHDSHRPIKLKKFLAKVVANFGGTEDIYADIVINKPSATRMSVDKYLMKKIFKINYIPSFQFGEFFDEVAFPLVLKSKRHIKNYPHLTLVTTQEELTAILSRIPNKEKFYWEKFVLYDREFRIHMSHYKHSDVFSTEKILRRDRVRGWIRNKESCVFKAKFDKPNEWSDILDSCRRVLDKTDLDIAGFDVAYDTATCRHYIIEVNTACGMGDNTRKAYTKELNRIAIIKHFGL